MNASFIFAAFILFAGAVIAQEGIVEEVEVATTVAPTTEDVATFRCTVGKTTNGTGEMLSMGCQAGQDSCQTRIEMNGVLRIVTKMCKAKDACENNMANNAVDCYSDAALEKNVQVCHFCCMTDDCNTLTEIPEQEVEEETPEAPETPEAS